MKLVEITATVSVAREGLSDGVLDELDNAITRKLKQAIEYACETTLRDISDDVDTSGVTFIVSD